MNANHMTTVAVTGATGALGSRVAARLAQRLVPQLLVARNPAALKALPNSEVRGPAPYDDSKAMQAALRGAETLLLVSGDPTGRRLEEHATAVEAARAVGVQRVLYVSLLGAGPVATYRNARDHWLTEQFLAGCGMRYTVVRAGFYGATPAALADANLIVSGPSGAGTASFVTHDDIADVITAVLLTSGGQHDGATLEVTGPEALNMADAVAEIAKATGKPYRFEPETVEEAFERRWRLGMSGVQIESWISWYQAVARGDVATTTDVVHTVTGRPATPIRRSGWWPEPNTAF